MHWLSDQNRSEFLACPQLVRFEYAQGKDGFEPTILIKGSTLLLKYIVLGAPMQLAFAKCENRLVCALRISDDGADGGILWSVVEREEELKGILGLSNGEPLVAFLFNEIAVNVSWNNLPISREIERLRDMTASTKLGPFDHSSSQTLLYPMLEKLHFLRGTDADWIVLDVGGKSDWKPVKNHFITASASSSLIDIFDSDEGNQQEQIGVWLTDNLQPFGVYHSPQRPHKDKERRELTDILLSHQYGPTLIESKTLSVLARSKLPDRAKLKQDVAGHISKAFKQLRGGIRKLKDGVEITSLSGEVLEVERQQPAHAIVLVPDLDLIDSPNEYDHKFITDFMKETGGFPHILDISELLRVVQAAEMIVARGTSTTLMMAFYYYLIERAKKAAKAGNLRIEVILRFDDE